MSSLITDIIRATKKDALTNYEWNQIIKYAQTGDMKSIMREYPKEYIHYFPQLTNIRDVFKTENTSDSKAEVIDVTIAPSHRENDRASIGLVLASSVSFVILIIEYNAERSRYECESSQEALDFIFEKVTEDKEYTKVSIYIDIQRDVCHEFSFDIKDSITEHLVLQNLTNSKYKNDDRASLLIFCQKLPEHMAS